jgi:hypothetical protein
MIFNLLPLTESMQIIHSNVILHSAPLDALLLDVQHRLIQIPLCVVEPARHWECSGDV